MNNEHLLLLVEDDLGHAKLVLNTLKKHKIPNRVIHLSDGAEALDYLKNNGNFKNKKEYPLPGLILLDLRLPKVDGLEVLKLIKKDKILHKIPVIILTTSDAEDDINKAYEHNINSYLVKPLDFDEFKEMLNDFGLYWFLWNKQIQVIDN